MMTIKLVFASDPHREEVHEALQVRTQGIESTPGVSGPHKLVSWRMENEYVWTTASTEDCAVYVMNEKGKTISVYALTAAQNDDQCPSRKAA